MTAILCNVAACSRYTMNDCNFRIAMQQQQLLVQIQITVYVTGTTNNDNEESKSTKLTVC